MDRTLGKTLVRSLGKELSAICFYQSRGSEKRNSCVRGVVTPGYQMPSTDSEHLYPLIVVWEHKNFYPELTGSIPGWDII